MVQKGRQREPHLLHSFSLSSALWLFSLPRTVFPPLLFADFPPRAKPDIFFNDKRMEKKTPLSLLLSPVTEDIPCTPTFCFKTYLLGWWDRKKR